MQWRMIIEIRSRKVDEIPFFPFISEETKVWEWRATGPRFELLNLRSWIQTFRLP